MIHKDFEGRQGINPDAVPLVTSMLAKLIQFKHNRNIFNRKRFTKKRSNPHPSDSKITASVGGKRFLRILFCLLKGESPAL